MVAPTPPPRAVTLIELLIVLALVVAIAALALPTTLESMARRQFESDVDSLLGQLRLARNHARTTASAVEVTIVADGAGVIRVTAVSIDVRDLAHDAVVAGEGGDRSGADASINGESARSSGAIDASWADARYTLSLDESEAAAAQSEGKGPAPRRVALFLADGGAPIAARLTVRDDDGRVATIVVNPWTGLASTRDGPPTAALAGAPADDLEPPEDAIENDGGVDR